MRIVSSIMTWRWFTLCKVFKSGSVYEEQFFEHDIKVTNEAAKIIRDFNALKGSMPIYLNEPGVVVATSRPFASNDCSRCKGLCASGLQTEGSLSLFLSISLSLPLILHPYPYPYSFSYPYPYPYLYIPIPVTLSLSQSLVPISVQFWG
jgi:hypothetical protein